MDYPKLRSIDAFPCESSGQKVIGLRDPSRLDDKVLLVSYPVFFVMSLFDGTRSLLDIKTEYMRKFGEILYAERLEEIIHHLDDHYLLENERFATYRRKLEEEFTTAHLRKAVFAGTGYDADPHKLMEQIDGFFIAPRGPGTPGAARTGEPLKGLIAPHIDFQRGGTCYAWPYKALLELPPPDLFIVLGTVHVPTKNPFVLTRKNFETPLGTVPSETALIESLEKKLPFDPFQDEIVHKTEHTIEFQLLFLNYCFRNEVPFKIIPVLCSSFHDAINEGVSPLDKPDVRAFITALRETVEASPYQTCFIASADLAHCGIRFGDASPPSNDFLRNLEREDRALLSSVEAMDSESFYRSVQRDKDRRNICGLPPIYTLLSVLDADKGTLLDYQQSVEPGGGSVVSYAGMVFS
jgi:AmmeMemoRadiSam system protein B